MRALKNDERPSAASEVFKLRISDGDVSAQHSIGFHGAIQHEGYVRRSEFAVSFCNDGGEIKFLHEAVQRSQIIDGKCLWHVHIRSLQHTAVKD